MSYFTRAAVTVNTSSDGTATAYSTAALTGYVQAVRLSTDTTLTSSGRATITAERSGLAILTSSGLDAAFTSYPRAVVVDTNQTGLYYSTGSTGAPIQTLIPLAQERIKVEISIGGGTKTGGFTFLVGG